MREASSLVLAARLQAEGARVRAYDPVAEEAARPLMPGVEFSERALDARRTAPTRSCSSPSGRSSRELDWDDVAERHGGHARDRRAQRARPRARAAAGFTYEGIGRGQMPEHAGADPGRRRGHAAAAADLDGPQAGAAAGRPAVHHLHARLAAAATASTTSSCRAASWPPACATCSATARRSACACATSRSRGRSAPAGRSSSPSRCSTSASWCSTATSSPTST